MYYDVIKLTDCFPALKNCKGRDLAHVPTLTAYCPDNSKEIDLNRVRPSILICPGGGYQMVSFREAEPVALSFASQGYNAFVLDYDVFPAKYPCALLEVSAAAAYIRKNAEKFHSSKLAVCGFSAGAHLASSLGVFFDEPFIADTLGFEHGFCRPDAMILCYPVISSGEFAHLGSFTSLLGENASKEMLEKMSIDKQITKNTPPAFIWHTFADDDVPVENSLLLANALRKNGVKFELHIYPDGGHGLSLCNRITNEGGVNINAHCETWFKLCLEWLKIVF